MERYFEPHLNQVVKKSGSCLLSAWVSDRKLVLGQQKVDTKSNEKTAIPELLKSLDLKDSIVTIDVVACGIKNADIITSKEEHYMLVLKNNNKNICQQVSERFAQVKTQLPKYEHVDSGNSQIETQTCYVENNLTLYDDLAH